MVQVRRALLYMAAALAFPLYAVNFQSVHDYKSMLAVGNDGADSLPLLAMRSFSRNDTLWLLCCNPWNLGTRIVEAGKFVSKTVDWMWVKETFTSAPYVLELMKAEGNCGVAREAGIGRIEERKKNGIDLTIDLCPSNKPMARKLFTELLDEFAAIQSPIPVSIAISGHWIEKHESDLAWLDSLEKTGTLSITWINHTFSHKTGPNREIRPDFMSDLEKHISSEVLRNEAALIHYGLLPSVFFRFPGLVADSSVCSRVIGLGLIPIGSDSWLAKGQVPREGSIVLIHGNGNEPYGIKKFIELLHSRKSDILSKKWLLLDLRESIVTD